MRKTLGLLVLLSISLIFVACGKSESQNAAVKTTTGSAPTNLSPTETFMAYAEMVKKNNLAQALRTFTSKASLKVMEDSAKSRGMTLEELAQNENNRQIPTTLPQVRNEKISGDTATIEYQWGDAPDVWAEMPLVKEDGQWKLESMKSKTIKASGPPPSPEASTPTGPLTPTETFLAYVKAAKEQNIEAMKNLLSTGSRKELESAVKGLYGSLDEFLESLTRNLPTSPPLTRKETINGDTATLEIYWGDFGWERLPLVREDGQWKLEMTKKKEIGDKKK